MQLPRTRIFSIMPEYSLNAQSNLELVFIHMFIHPRILCISFYCYDGITSQSQTKKIKVWYSPTFLRSS